MHCNLATMQADLSLGPAPAVADAASATIMRRAGELLRVLTRTGAEVLSCDVGDRNSDAVIKLTTTTITAGGPVRLDSFQLSMP